MEIAVELGFVGFGWPGVPGTFHAGGENALFCDGHVESSKSDQIPQEVGRDGLARFKRDPERARRWNNDHEANMSTWPKH